MAKIQQIKRSNGSLIHSVNIPKEIMKKLEWQKGDELEFIFDEDENQCILRKNK